MGGVFFDTNVFISHASSSVLEFPEWLRLDVMEYEVRQAVLGYLNQRSRPNRRAIERCIAACRLLDNLSDEDWDALAPRLVDEIVVLHNENPPLNH